MNETLSVYLDYDLEDPYIEDVISRMDEAIRQEGWEYTGMGNLYAPIEQETRDETIGNVIRTLKNAEWLKPYKLRILTGNKVDSLRLDEIDVTGMSRPSQKKLLRYENYYHLTKRLAHNIVVDEKGKIRSGYISYLLAKKYAADVGVLSSWSNQPVKKAVLGRHICWDGAHYFEKSKKKYCWIYDLRDAVVPGDILLVYTRSGYAYMRVSRITYITGGTKCSEYRKVRRNETANI